MEIQIQKKQQKEKVLVGKLIPHKGHKIFEINTITLEIIEAKYQELSFIIGKTHQNKEIIINKDCVYIWALNKKTAFKKYLKGDNGSKF